MLQVLRSQNASEMRFRFAANMKRWISWLLNLYVNEIRLLFGGLFGIFLSCRSIVTLRLFAGLQNRRGDWRCSFLDFSWNSSVIDWSLFRFKITLHYFAFYWTICYAHSPFFFKHLEGILTIFDFLNSVSFVHFILRNRVDLLYTSFNRACRFRFLVSLVLTCFSVSYWALNQQTIIGNYDLFRNNGEFFLSSFPCLNFVL